MIFIIIFYFFENTPLYLTRFVTCIYRVRCALLVHFLLSECNENSTPKLLKKDYVGLADIEESDEIISCQEQVEILKKRLIEANNNIQLEVRSYISYFCPDCTFPFSFTLYSKTFLVGFPSSCVRITQTLSLGLSFCRGQNASLE